MILTENGPLPALSDAASVGEPDELKRDWNLLTSAVFLFAFGFATYNGIFQNFLKESIGARELQLGVLESLREVPGLLAALTAGAIAHLPQGRVAAIGLFITAIGIGVTGVVPQYWGIVGISMFWSVGFHLWATVQSSITMALARGESGGRHLGRLGSVGAVATIAALGSSWLITQLVSQDAFPVFFGVGGVCILVASGLAGALSHRADEPSELRLVIRREYSLYYWLIFLEGCRRQIFSIFAFFTLIQEYNARADEMLVLQFVNAILIAITAPVMGRLIDKKGEREPLLWYGIGLIVVFLGYATIPNKSVLMVLFILDNVLFTFGVGFTTYLNRIARPGELRPCIAMGVTMNHIAAVSVPLLGALAWKQSGSYTTPFFAGVVVAVLSLLATRRLPRV